MFLQIGINLTDPIFRGNYHGKQAHEDDFEHVLDRACKHGVKHLIVTGSDLAESEKAVQIARDHRMSSLLFAPTTNYFPSSSINEVSQISG